ESKVETPLPAEAPSSTPVQPVQESKTEPKTETLPAQNNVPETPTDSVTVLRDQITAASGAERIRLQLKLVEELLATNKNSEALSELSLITTADAFDPQSFYNAGNSLARLGDNNVAIEAYRKAIEQRKGNYSRALNNLGVVLLRQGRWDESYEALSAALQIENFHYAEASYNLGRVFAARGQNDLAIREWRRVLRIDPSHSAPKLAIANAGNEGKIVEAQPATPVARPVAKPAANVVAADKPTSQPSRSAANPR